MYDFSEKKFLMLPFERQHKKLAELLRFAYEQLNKKEISEEIRVYNQLCTWINAKPLESLSFKNIADRYHWHLQTANQSLKEHRLLPAIRKGDRQEGSVPWEIDIYLDHLRSAHNVGSILRTTEALALGSVYFSTDTPFIDHKQVQDASMGTYQWLNCYQGPCFKTLKRPLIAIETSDEALCLYDFLFPEAFTLVMGNEEYGCSDQVLAEADILIEIPLRGRKNSLNVANAFAMVAGEIQRQKRENKNA